ncbi:MAG: Arc family DNA-binding protein [Candidatus Nanopelagicaceae bacterium]
MEKRKRGRPRTDTVTVVVRLPLPIKEQAVKIAEAEQRSLNSLISIVVQKFVEEQGND